MRLNKTRTAQTWSMEFILAFLIFSSAIILSIKLVTNIYKDEGFTNLMKDSEVLSNQLLSEGSPNNWTSDDVIRLGILTNNKINETKLNSLFDIDYYDSKRLLTVNYDYYLFLKKDNEFIMINNNCGYGYNITVIQENETCIIDLSDLNYKNLVKNSRLTIYNNSIVELNTYSWDIK